MVRSPETVVDGSREFARRNEGARFANWLAAAPAVSGLACAVATWQEPHRTAIVILLVTGAATVALPIWSSSVFTQRPRLRMLLFVLRSIAVVAMIATLTALDGGVSSPFALLFFVRVVFVAMNHPLRSVVFIGVLDVAALVAAG